MLGLQHPAAGEGAAGFAGGAAAAALKAAAAAPEAAAAVAGCRSHGAERCWQHRVPSLLEGGSADMAAHGEGAGMGQRRPGEEEEREGGEKQQGEEAQRAVRQQKGAREGMGVRGAAFVRGQGWGTGAEFSFLLLCLKPKPCPVPPSATAGGVNPCYPADKKRGSRSY